MNSIFCPGFSCTIAFFQVFVLVKFLVPVILLFFPGMIIVLTSVTSTSYNLSISSLILPFELFGVTRKTYLTSASRAMLFSVRTGLIMTLLILILFVPLFQNFHCVFCKDQVLTIKHLIGIEIVSKDTFHTGKVAHTFDKIIILFLEDKKSFSR